LKLLSKKRGADMVSKEVLPGKRRPCGPAIGSVLALLLVLANAVVAGAEDRVVKYVGLPAGHPVFKDRNGAWLLLEAKEPKEEYSLLRLKEATAELTLNLSSGTVNGSLRLLWKEEPSDGNKLGFARKMSLQGTFSPAGYDPGGNFGREPLIKGTFADEYHGSTGEWVGYLNDDRGVIAHERDFVDRGTTLNYQTTFRKRGSPWRGCSKSDRPGSRA
jgi:hypothetical protein